MAMEGQSESQAYAQILAEYLRTHSEDALYQSSLLSQTLVEGGLGPEDIVALHFETLNQAVLSLGYREQARALADGHYFLLEVMIAYGVKYKEFLEIRMQDALQEAAGREERERQRALDAERVGRQKGEILGVIAHELRTPLAAVQGNIDLAKRSLTRGQVDRLPELLERARAAIERLSRLSADLVQASRGELPEMVLSEQDLGDVLTQSCAWAQPAALASDLHFVFNVVDQRVRVIGIADGLLSIFGNLLSNAVRYTPEGGRITVTWGLEQDWVWVSIQDTGLGMASDVQERIFEKFYRAPDARRAEPKGLGLGLSLVQQMIEVHGGRLEVQSQEGQGSTFRVLLPLIKSLEEE
jgi:signal transduction histidine kinase